MSRRVRKTTLVLVNSPIVAGLIGASFGLVLANFSTGNEAGPPRWALMGVFIAAILSAAFVYNRLLIIGGKVERLENSTDLIRLDRHSGGMDLVVGLVENSSTIRVIGRARQDLLSTPTSAQFDYLKATQESVRSGNLRVYRRITGDHLREPFRQHLLELIDSRRPGQIVEVGLVNSIDTLISYQVFDATAAIIGIETARVPGVRDSTIVLLTHQAAIIEALISHFDSAWSSVSPIVESAALKANTTIQV